MAPPEPPKPPATSKDKPNLLTIPQEIRDMIIKNVISTVLPCAYFNDDAVAPQRLPYNPADGLLTTNKALHAQVLATSFRLNMPLTLIIGANNGEHRGHVPCQLRFNPQSGESKVLQRLDIMTGANFAGDMLKKHGDDAAWFAADYIFFALDRLIPHGLDVCPRDCAGHSVRVVSEACYEDCGIREFHVYIPNMPKFLEHLDVMITQEIVENLDAFESVRCEKWPNESITLWDGNVMVRRYDLAKAWEVACQRAS